MFLNLNDIGQLFTEAQYAKMNVVKEKIESEGVEIVEESTCW